MKKLGLAILCTILFSCSDSREKPEHLLTEAQMEDILYDIALLQSINSFAPRALDTNKVSAKYYIYRKYDIDSTIFAQNNTYYATDLEQYDRIQERVLERISAKRDSIKNIGKGAAKPKKKAPGLTEAEKMRKIDSLRNSFGQKSTLTPK